MKNLLLYQSLGVPPDASKEQISRACRRLKREGKPGDGPHGWRHAWTILSRHDTREIYDKHGELGLTVLGRIESPALTKFFLHRQLEYWLLSLVIAGTFLVAMVPFMVTSASGGSWVLSYTPFWLLDAIVWVTLIGCKTLVYRFCEGGKAKRVALYDLLCSSLAYTVLVGLLSLSQALVAAKLDGYLRITWSRAFTPYFVFEALEAVYKVARLLQLALQWDDQDPVMRKTEGALAYQIYRAYGLSVPRTLALLLHLGKMEWGAAYEWDWTLTPLIIGLPVFAIAGLLYDLAYRRAALTISTAKKHATSTSIIYLKFALLILAIAILKAVIVLNHAHLSVGSFLEALGYSTALVLVLMALGSLEVVMIIVWVYLRLRKLEGEEHEEDLYDMPPTPTPVRRTIP